MTNTLLHAVVRDLLRAPADDGQVPALSLEEWLEPRDESIESAVCALNAAFLIGLAGPSHPASARARSVLEQPPRSVSAELVEFYRNGLTWIGREFDERGVADRRSSSADAGEEAGVRLGPAEALWSVLFPEGVGILGHEEERIAELRARRTVSITRPNPRPITDPAREVLFTSNVLLTVPSASTDIDALPYPEKLRRQIRLAAAEPQEHWYDHPIQIGVEPDRNELLYGLRGLDRAMEFERSRDPSVGRMTVLLSVSVTHARLQQVAHEYVREELRRSQGMRNLQVHVFTERDTSRLVREVLAPVAGADAEALMSRVFGTDGEYGRHYSFLKAVAAFWHVLIDPGVRATFKIDLDQVFAQDVLVAQTGATALEHLATPLWGATGLDSSGSEVELGMIAGALVNERDIGRGLFTPDVDFPSGPGALDEYAFFSRLPQALSTRAEMMERYDSAARDGRRTCLERVHVTGGTNGILVDSLRRHRPFTPTFVGRAEDQAYLMSVLGDGLVAPGSRLAYLHAAGLIMRHDKEAFAGEAIAAARVGKLIGDDVRILLFSAYAETLDRERVKALLDPFTGCFISRLPVTVVLLRLALRIVGAFQRGDPRLGRDLAENGAERIAQAISFTEDRDAFKRILANERLGWMHYYDALDALEAAGDDGAAPELRRQAREIVAATLIRA